MSVQRDCRELRIPWRTLKVAGRRSLIAAALMRFRLFFVDDLTRRIVSLIDFEAADAAEALAYAEERRQISSMELWSKGGLIQRWDSLPPNG
jgi:hypothetical protein